MKTAIALSLFLSSILSPASLAIEVVYSKYRDADSFKRISEHFSGVENPGRYTIARSDSNRRDGHYVALRIEKSDTPRLFHSIKAYYVKPGSTEVETASIVLQGKIKKRLLVGLTEPYWHSEENMPVAWKIEFLDANGNVVGQAESFLWSPRGS